jgi:hypothetical protein
MLGEFFLNKREQCYYYFANDFIQAFFWKLSDVSLCQDMDYRKLNKAP